jgi:carbon monoxide dehydrogenase subunit G
MGMKIEERFSVRAPAAAVWAYLVDPRRVVTCLPGAELVEVVDDRTFLGNVKIKVGPVTVSYKGRITMVEVDEAGRRVRMSGEGRETTGAGSARMAMESQLTERAGGETDVVVVSEVDVVGRLVQFGRGMIEQVSHQLFEQFATCVKGTLEAEARAGGVPAVAGPAGPVEPVAAIPLFFRALWAWFVGHLRALFGKKAG